VVYIKIYIDILSILFHFYNSNEKMITLKIFQNLKSGGEFVDLN